MLDWPEVLDAFEADWSAPVLVAGLDAAGLADRLARRASYGIAAEGAGWTLLAPEPPAEGPDSWADLPAGSVGTVILRRAWSERAALAVAAAAGQRLLSSGGRLFLAELDLDRLFGGSPVRYPYQYRFTLDPPAAERLQAAAVTAAELSLEVVRSGLRTVRGVDLEEVRAVYADPPAYWAAVRDGAWPTLRETPAEDREVLLERLAVELARALPMGEIVERRPWFTATGIRA